MEDLIGDLTAVPQPIEIKIFSDSGALLEKLGPKVAEAIDHVPGVVDVRDGIVPAGDTLEILIDPDKAALESVDPEMLTRMIAVTGRISGRDLGSVIRDIKKVLAGKGMIPAGAYFTLGGLYLQQRIAFTGLMAVFIAAVLLAFLLLLYLYERFRVALAMLATTLLSLSGVFLGLWLTGTDINISSMMGMTMIVGIVTEVAIFYYSEYRALPPGLEPHTALLTAGKNRLRPIAMTTLATILALMPLALGIGQGSAMQKPLAIAIISGLFMQFPLVLIGLPVFLELLGSSET
jgi:multidrug efflux pump subunit AcrB